MQAYCIAVGSELLGSTRLDTNSLWITSQLAQYGIEVIGKAVASDRLDSIRDAVRSAMRQAELSVITGGLGPTSDDQTREAVAELLELPLTEDPEIVASIRTRFRNAGLEMPESNRRQANVPRGARVLGNEDGTAPGLWLKHEGHELLLLPGVPREMKTMFSACVAPELARRFRGQMPVVAKFCVAGVAESEVEERLAATYELVGHDNVTVLAKPGDISIEVRSSDEEEISAASRQVEKAFGSRLYSRGESMAEVVVAECRARGLRVAVAESCTGGLLGGRLTSVPGASSVFSTGFVTYENQAKENQLGVSKSVLDRHGAVSEECAVAMAEGARVRAGVDLAAAITGVAGPAGGSKEKPVGTVCFAWSAAEEVISTTVRFPGKRELVRSFATQWALDGLRRQALAWPVPTA